jgi:hypothetical protein
MIHAGVSRLILELMNKWSRITLHLSIILIEPLWSQMLGPYGAGYPRGLKTAAVRPQVVKELGSAGRMKLKGVREYSLPYKPVKCYRVNTVSNDQVSEKTWTVYKASF